MQIDIENIGNLVIDADKIFLGPDGEMALVKLLEVKQQVDEAIDKAKELLEAKATELDPNFSSIQGDRVKVSYRFYGAKYYIEEDRADQVPEELYKVVKRYSVNTKELEEYIQEKNGLPVGIKEVDRKKSLNFKLKEAK